jgi:hypothetical protein
MSFALFFQEGSNIMGRSSIIGESSNVPRALIYYLYLIILIPFNIVKLFSFNKNQENDLLFLFTKKNKIFIIFFDFI